MLQSLKPVNVYRDLCARFLVNLCIKFLPRFARYQNLLISMATGLLTFKIDFNGNCRKNEDTCVLLNRM